MIRAARRGVGYAMIYAWSLFTLVVDPRWARIVELEPRLGIVMSPWLALAALILPREGGAP